MREMVPSVAYVMAMVLLLCRLDRGYAGCYIKPNAEGHVVWDVSTRGDSAESERDSGVHRVLGGQRAGAGGADLV